MKSGSTVEIGWNHVEPGPLAVSRQPRRPEKFQTQQQKSSVLYVYCLVVEPYPSEKYESQSVGMMTFPTYGQ